MKTEKPKRLTIGRLYTNGKKVVEVRAIAENCLVYLDHTAGGLDIYRRTYFDRNFKECDIRGKLTISP